MAYHYVSELSKQEDRERFQRLFERIKEEYNRTSEIVLQITGEKHSNSYPPTTM